MKRFLKRWKWYKLIIAITVMVLIILGFLFPKPIKVSYESIKDLKQFYMEAAKNGSMGSD